MKKSMKIISILMMAIMMIMVATPVFADVDPGKAIDDVHDKVDYGGNPDFSAKVGKIIGFLQWAGAIAGVLIITIFGIKYMMGSLEEKAEYKKSMMPYLIGALLIFAASTIATAVKGLFTF